MLDLYQFALEIFRIEYSTIQRKIGKLENYIIFYLLLFFGGMDLWEF
jgi:hypothetical protein